MTIFAGTHMVMIGIFHAVQGLVALFNDTFYDVGPEYVFRFDVTTWGWVHLVLGVVVAFAGVGLFRGAVWARTVAIAALDVFVIWATILHGSDILAE